MWLVLNVALKQILVYSDKTRKIKLSPINLDDVKHVLLKPKSLALVIEKVDSRMKFYYKSAQLGEEWSVAINDLIEVKTNFEHQCYSLTVQRIQFPAIPGSHVYSSA